MFLIYHKDSGKIESLLLANHLEEPSLEDGYDFLNIDAIADITKFYVDTGLKTIVAIPVKPSEYYIFNWNTKQWDYSEELYQQYLVDLDSAAKQKRNNLLLNSDWTELPSALTRLGETKVTQWQLYRQVLRDITTQSGYPENVIWPEQPV